MRRDVAADLEHDLVTVVEHERRRTAPRRVPFTKTQTGPRKPASRAGPSASPQIANTAASCSPLRASRTTPVGSTVQMRARQLARVTLPQPKTGSRTPIPAGTRTTRLFAKSSRWTRRPFRSGAAAHATCTWTLPAGGTEGRGRSASAPAQPQRDRSRFPCASAPRYPACRARRPLPRTPRGRLRRRLVRRPHHHHRRGADPTTSAASRPEAPVKRRRADDGRVHRDPAGRLAADEVQARRLDRTTACT